MTVSGRWREAGFGSLVLKSAGWCLFIRRGRVGAGGAGTDLGVARGPYLMGGSDGGEPAWLILLAERGWNCKFPSRPPGWETLLQVCFSCLLASGLVQAVMAVSLGALFVTVFEGGQEKVWNLGSFSYVLVSGKN